MRYRSMGGTGVRISAVSLGTGGQWGGRVDRSMAARIVATALDHGINYIDTADIYGTWYEGRRPLAEAGQEAVGLLVKLHDLAVHQGKSTTFEQRLDQIYAQHSRRAALLRRLRDAGLHPS